jgi:hypothetical protein
MFDSSFVEKLLNDEFRSCSWYKYADVSMKQITIHVTDDTQITKMPLSNRWTKRNDGSLLFKDTPVVIKKKPTL